MPIQNNDKLQSALDRTTTMLALKCLIGFSDGSSIVLDNAVKMFFQLAQGKEGHDITLLDDLAIDLFDEEVCQMLPNDIEIICLAVVAEALRNKERLDLNYINRLGEHSQRTVIPLALERDYQFSLIAWCELRNDFRCFNLNQMIFARRLAGSTFKLAKHQTYKAYLAKKKEEQKERRKRKA